MTCPARLDTESTSMEGDMSQEKQRKRAPLRDNEIMMTRRRRRQLFRERRERWEKRDQEEMVRRFPHPTRCRYADPGHVSRSKSEASHNQITQMRKCFKDLADQERWEDLDGLLLYLIHMAAEVRTTLPADHDARECLVKLHNEMLEALGIMMEAASDGRLVPPETGSIVRAVDGVIEVYKPTRRTLTSRSTEAVDLR